MEPADHQQRFLEMSGCLKSKNVSVTHFILTVDYVRTIDLQQACFFNVWPPSGSNKFAEFLYLAANSLSLAEKSGKNKGDEYSKTPNKPGYFFVHFFEGQLRPVACSASSFEGKNVSF